MCLFLSYSVSWHLRLTLVFGLHFRIRFEIAKLSQIPHLLYVIRLFIKSFLVTGVRTYVRFDLCLLLITYVHTIAINLS